MKVLPIHGNENWLCDRYAQEWKDLNTFHACPYNNSNDADVLWLLAPWEWKQIPKAYLETKKVVCTIHHMVPDKTDESTWKEFEERDKYIDAYHTPCFPSYAQFGPRIGHKPFLINPFWCNNEIFKPIDDKIGLREKYGIKQKAHLMGSFQRDTEGSDLSSPKLEKGPDVFCDIIEKEKEKNPDVEVLLAGWRRQYVINRLNKAGIKYYYFELPSIKTINELYNCLDLYVVAARYEGGPQSIPECIMTNTPIVSTPVGLSSKLLHPKSIFSSSSNFNRASPDLSWGERAIAPYIIPEGFKPFNDFFDSL